MGAKEKTTIPKGIFVKICCQLEVLFLPMVNGKCIAEIANKICQVPRIAKYPVGIKSRVEEVKSLLKVESGGVYFIGLWGRCGVGKTTVAREIFYEISCQGSFSREMNTSILKKKKRNYL
ncbi:disease resistance protein RPS6-like [Solanum tuberosum]|uniref:disease resistance protein RPS6-like n=1 Tax=Solanum tuberosum TaxID=4113 RepID=UPI00073A481D|nr:PREDICTED: disease resistance protein RPS6-like [Solanum tuberosum]